MTSEFYRLKPCDACRYILGAVKRILNNIMEDGNESDIVNIFIVKI